MIFIITWWWQRLVLFQTSALPVIQCMWFKPGFMGKLNNRDPSSSATSKSHLNGGWGHSQRKVVCFTLQSPLIIEEKKTKQNSDISKNNKKHCPAPYTHVHHRLARWSLCYLELCKWRLRPESTPGKVCLPPCVTSAHTLTDFSSPFGYFPTFPKRDNPPTVRKM